MCGHSSRERVAPPLQQPTRAASRNQAHLLPLFGLAPGGVYRAGPVARTAVRSCRTLSPLPVPSLTLSAGGILSVALSLIPFSVGLGRPPGVTRHRGSMEPGLSSLEQAPPRPPSPLARPIWAIAAGAATARAIWRGIRHR